MKLSICTTLYKSAPYIEAFVARSSNVARELVGDDYEIIMVDDGSPDNSLAIAAAMTENNPHLQVIELSRNFGHHKALMTALKFATGDWVYLLDSDLEEEPEWLLPFSVQMQNSDVVYGVQEKRKGNWFEKISGAIAHRIFRFFIDKDLPLNICTARLMKKKYVADLLKFEEREMMMLGICQAAGYRQLAYPVKKHHTSPTTYSFVAKWLGLLNGIIAFSSKPLTFIFYFGMLISFCAAIYATYIVGRTFFNDAVLVGWSSIMASIWLLGGIIIAFIGLVGMYLAKVYSEVKRRPYTLIKDIYRRSNSPLNHER